MRVHPRWYPANIRAELSDSEADADGERVLCVLGAGSYQVGVGTWLSPRRLFRVGPIAYTTATRLETLPDIRP
jgi:hypothetical protein